DMAATTRRTDAIWFFDNLAHIRVSGDQTEGRVAVVELAGRHGHMPPLHIHHLEDEAFVVLKGELKLYVDDAVIPLRAGGTGFGPKGVPHTFRVESDTARWLAVAAPAVFDRSVLAAGEPADEPVLPAEPVIPDP